MHVATTRSIIAAAGLVAIGLVAWPHQATAPQAQLGGPTVHRAVALVDHDTTVIGDETAYDSKLFDNYFGADGKEAALYDKVVAADGPTEAATRLDIPAGTEPPYAGNFDGAESRLFEAMYIEKLVSENVANREFLGVDKTDSETAILADLSSHPGDFPLPSGDTLPAVGAPDFDTILQQVAVGDKMLAHQDFQDYLASLHSAASELGSAAASVGDVGDVSGVAASVSDVGGFSGDLSTIVSDLTGGLF